MKKNKKIIKESRIQNEIVVELMLNNIISSVIRIIDCKKIYENEDIHCFKYLSKLCQPYLLTEFLPHESVRIYSNNENKLFYNLPKNSKKDCWTVVKEPEACIIDRCSDKTNILKVNKINKKDIINNHTIKTIIDKKGYIDKDNEKKNNQDMNKLNIIVNDENKKDIIDKKENNKDIYKDYKVIVRKKKKVFKNMFGEREMKEEITDKMIEMPSIDINNDIESQNIYKKEEYNKLRKEYFELKQRMNIDNNNNSNFLIIKPRRGSKQLKNLFIKYFDNSRLTFDSNGKIINLNYQKFSQASSEFNFPKHKIINNLLKYNLKKNNKKMTVKEKKPIITSFEKKNLNSNDKNEDISKTNQRRTKNNDNSTTDNDKFINNSNNNLNNDLEKIEYNPLDHKHIFYVNKYYSNKKKKMLVGGQNFDKIMPEVGVIISDDNKKERKKIGGFRYMSKYNKPSLSELTKILDNKGNFKSMNNFSLSFNSENNEMINYNGYNEEFNENNNPLFQNAHFIINQDRILSPVSNNIKNKNFTIDINDTSNKNQNKRYLKYSSSQSSLLKNRSCTRIDNIILSHNKKINDIYNILKDEKNENDNNRNNKELSNKYYKGLNLMSVKDYVDVKRKLPLINNIKKREEELMKGRKIINKFNSNIIKNKDWGSNIIINNENNHIFPNNIFRREKYRKLRIIEDNNNNIGNRNYLSGRNNQRRRFFSSSSIGILIS